MIDKKEETKAEQLKRRSIKHKEMHKDRPSGGQYAWEKKGKEENT